MTFDEVLARVLDLLQRQGRVSYRVLKRRFDLDDEISKTSRPKSSRRNSSPGMRRGRCWCGRGARRGPRRQRRRERPPRAPHDTARRISPRRS